MRIDKYLAEQYSSRSKAAAAISKGLVLINGKAVQPSYEYRDNDEITILQDEESYVSNGGYKLAKALKDFDFSVDNKVYADIGASTGGFTDCLIQNGVKRVYCIDVGESQLDKSLIGEKTVVIDNFNARELCREMFPEMLDGAVIDVSFISLTYILGAVADVLDNGCHVFALIKPQFECESRNVGKKGIVKNVYLHKKIILKICEFSLGCGLTPLKLTNAPIVAGKNMEYMILLEKGSDVEFNEEKLIKSVKL